MTEPSDKPVVLVVDDTPEYLTVLGEMLSPHYTVRVANSGRRALELVHVSPRPDLILLDVMMPEMDGLQVLSALREDACSREIPAIFITGLDDTADEIAGLRVGAVDYIVKPLSAPVVLARVNTHVSLKRAREALQARTEALQRSIADMETFSYSLSHDLRSPLSTISGFADLLRRIEAPRMSEEGVRRLGRIIDSAQRMDHTIRDILARIQADRAEMKRKPVDLAALARDVLHEAGPAYPEAEVVIGELPVVSADATMVRQVLANLIGNALKFSSKAEKARVEVGVRAVEGGPEIAREVFVRDNGAGFDAQNADKLFTMFQRLHPESDFKGTGVGLAIVKRLIERHGGTIRADSQPGQGATFSFTLWPPTGPVPGADNTNR
jgi:two-component system sensor histidine kinase/response regulator